MALFLFVVLVAVALGIIGVAIKGLLFLLAIGIALVLCDLALFGLVQHRARRRPAHQHLSPANVRRIDGDRAMHRPIRDLHPRNEPGNEGRLRPQPQFCLGLYRTGNS